ncbi:MAG: ZrgA family zinc uptake protein [Pseudomonadota bacterium]
MQLHRFLSFLPALALATLPAATLASDNPGSHQHGHARLQMAIEGERIDVLLLSPAANLVGFEHAPETDEQHEKVAELDAWASQTPLINTAPGTCTVNQADVHDTWPAGDEHDHGHDHQQEGHADIEISQTLACPGLSSGDELETTVMVRFPAMEQLDVQWVSPQNQGGTRLTSGQSRFPAPR